MYYTLFTGQASEEGVFYVVDTRYFANLFKGGKWMEVRVFADAGVGGWPINANAGMADL